MNDTDILNELEAIGIAAKKAEAAIRVITEEQKNGALKKIADELIENIDIILNENKKDTENAKLSGMSESMLDRLRLSPERIRAMSEGVYSIMALSDPVGKILSERKLQNGLKITKKSVPLGVVGIIYESRPNVTADAAAICLKSGNVSVLRGGSDAINTNKCLVKIMRHALLCSKVAEDAILLVENTSRESVNMLMRMNKYIDVLIPRGGRGLIQSVVNNSSVPVIQTGEGNCSIYIDYAADIKMAVDIVDNAKTQRPSVCNAAENLIVHKDIAESFLKALKNRWNDKVRIIGDSLTSKYIKIDRSASDEDYKTEFLDYVISVKVVEDIDAALDFINKYGTKHSECIVTSDLKNAERFQAETDAAAVYVNASTRFTDGGEFGFGAEIGISTQKLHARGPMGLSEMTSYKYLINGDGHIR